MTYESNSNVISVKFLGFQIWRSDDDERYFDSEKNEYESLAKFLEKKARYLVTLVSSINVR